MKELYNQRSAVTSSYNICWSNMIISIMWLHTISILNCPIYKLALWCLNIVLSLSPSLSLSSTFSLFLVFMFLDLPHCLFLFIPIFRSTPASESPFTLMYLFLSRNKPNQIKALLCCSQPFSPPLIMASNPVWSCKSTISKSGTGFSISNHNLYNRAFIIQSWSLCVLTSEGS